MRKRDEPLWRAALLIVGLALAVQLLEYWGLLASPEGLLLDLILGKVRFVQPAKPTTIVTLEIDDAAFKDCFTYSPMDPEGIGALVGAAAEPDKTDKNKKPRVIGVDIITDSEQQDDLAGYMKLEKQFAGKPVVWAAGVEKSSLEEGESFGEWFAGGEPIAVQPTTVLGTDRQPSNPLHWGLPIYPREEDLHLRRFPRTSIVPPGKSQFNWASQVANVYTCPDWAQDWSHPCIDSKSGELFISFAGPVKMPAYKMSKLFNCKPLGRHNVTIARKDSELWQQFSKDANGSIVLIGGTFRSARDTYATPIGPLDGLLFNAYAVQAELAGTGVSEVPPWRRGLLDVLLGLMIGFTFRTSWISSTRLNLRILICLLWLLLTVALSFFVLHPFKYVWLSCVGIAVGMTIHVLIEIWKEDLELRHEHNLGRSAGA